MFPSQYISSASRGWAGNGPKAEYLCFAVISEPRYYFYFSKAWVVKKHCLEIETILHAPLLLSNSAWKALWITWLMQRGDCVFPINNALSLYFSFAPQCFSCLYRWSEETSLQIPAKSRNPCRWGAHRTVHLHRARTSGRYPSSLLKGPVQPRWKLWGSIWSLLNSHSRSSLAAHRATLWFAWQLYSYLGLALISVAG